MGPGFAWKLSRYKGIRLTVAAFGQFSKYQAPAVNTYDGSQTLISVGR